MIDEKIMEWKIMDDKIENKISELENRIDELEEVIKNMAVSIAQLWETIQYEE